MPPLYASSATLAIPALGGVIGLPAGWLAERVVRHFAAGSPRRRLVLIAATAAAFVWASLTAPLGWVLAVSLGLGWCLLCLAAIDLAVFRLPDVFTLPLLGTGILVAALAPGAPILAHAAGAVIGYAVLAGLAWLFRRLRGVEGMGLGDAKLLAAAGAWLGWEALPSVLLIACLLAFAGLAVARIRGGAGAARGPIAFGAPLALAFWTVWLHGPLAIPGR